MLLGDLGADVVKVEPPEGDATRGWGPPWVGSEADGTRTAAYYLAVNRNKRSLRLDLKTADGAEILRRLLRRRRRPRRELPGRRVRPARLRRRRRCDALNPGLVHLAISGYGPTGPAADRPGYDFVIQAASGLMSITGAPDADGGGPTKVGVAISDVVTGMLGAVGVLAALVGRERDGGPAAGRGQRIDVSLLGRDPGEPRQPGPERVRRPASRPGRLGNAHPNIVPYETFETADGAIAVAVGSERQWPRLCAALGLPGPGRRIRASRRTATGSSAGRSCGRSWPRGSPSATGRGLARPRSRRPRSRAGRSTTSSTAFASPEAVALGMTVEQEHPAWGVIRQVGVPFRAVGDAGVDPDAAADCSAQDTDAILGELGYAAAEIAAAARATGSSDAAGSELLAPERPGRGAERERDQDDRRRRPG